MAIKVFFDLIIRCLFSKPWPKLEPRVALSVGKFSLEKIQDLGAFWANRVDLKHPGLTFATEAGLESESKEALKDKEEQQKEVDLQNLRELKKGSSDGPDPDLLSPKFSRGMGSLWPGGGPGPSLSLGTQSSERTSWRAPQGSLRAGLTSSRDRSSSKWSSTSLQGPRQWCRRPTPGTSSSPLCTTRPR